MNEMRKIYLRRNTLMSIVFEILTIICGFILPRYILLYFGSDTNGLVSSIINPWPKIIKTKLAVL